MACEQDTTVYANAVRAVARYTNSLREVHWRTVVCTFEYFCSTSDLGLRFEKGSELELGAFADADYANKATDFRSVSGVVIMCAGAGVLVF